MKYFIVFWAILAAFCTIKSEDYEIKHQTERKVYQKGVATWYGPGFHGQTTSSGEKYDMYKFTAAHRKLPFGTIIRVKNLANNRCVIVRINDRGPVNDKLILDLSKIAANQIAMTSTGNAVVEVEILALTENPLEKIFMVYTNLGNE